MRHPGEPVASACHGTSVRDSFATTLQIALENKELLSSNVDHYKAIILIGTDDRKDFPDREGNCWMMLIPEAEGNQRDVETINFAIVPRYWFCWSAYPLGHACLCSPHQWSARLARPMERGMSNLTRTHYRPTLDLVLGRD